MNNFFKFTINISNIKKLIFNKFFETVFFLILIISLIFFIYLFSSFFHKGFDFTDESYYLLSYQNPIEFKKSFSFFHFFGHLLFVFSDYNIVNLRHLGLLLLTTCTIFCIYSAFEHLKYHHKKIFENKDLLILVLAGILSSYYYYFSIYIPTPNYNLFNLCLLLTLTGVILNYLRAHNDYR